MTNSTTQENTNLQTFAGIQPKSLEYSISCQLSGLCLVPVRMCSTSQRSTPEVVQSYSPTSTELQGCGGVVWRVSCMRVLRSEEKSHTHVRLGTGGTGRTPLRALRLRKKTVSTPPIHLPPGAISISISHLLPQSPCLCSLLLGGGREGGTPARQTPGNRGGSGSRHPVHSVLISYRKKKSVIEWLSTPIQSHK